MCCSSNDCLIHSPNFIELKDVDKPELALEVLHDLITSRRHRSWTKVHEQIMIEYINLCIDMRKVDSPPLLKI